MVILFVPCYMAQAQLNTSTGTGWGIDLFTSEPLILNENFQGFEFFHSDSNPDDGNSDNTFGNSGDIVSGYKSFASKAPIWGTTDSIITYDFKHCAFAPQWKTAYAYAGQGENTDNVSDGFVEISRKYTSSPPTVSGYFIIDLSAIEYVEIIQWSHSSTGGNKRGVMCEFSIDKGASWDTLRYQPGTAYRASFTKDVATRVKTYNGYRCDPSAYGMLWEDAIFHTGGIMLRFSECGGQTPRIHDLKVYGTYNSTPAQEIKNRELKIYCFNRKINISAYADVEIYNIAGTLVKKAKNVNHVDLGCIPQGVYIVKAKHKYLTNIRKVLVK